MDAVNSLSQQTSAVNLLAHTYQQTLSLILSLCKKTGYCWAHNDALARLRGKDETTITRHVARLVKDGFLRWERVGNERWLFPVKNAYPIKRQCADSSTTIETSTKRQPTPPTPTVQEPASVVVSPLLQNSVKNAISPDAIAEEYNKANAAPNSQDGVSTPCTHGTRARSKTPTPDACLPDSLNNRGDVSAIIPDLQAEGIKPPIAAKLASAVNVERIQAYLREYRRLRQAGQVRGVGWLIRALSEGWTIPEAKQETPVILSVRREVLDRQTRTLQAARGELPDMAYLRGRLGGGIGV